MDVTAEQIAFTSPVGDNLEFGLAVTKDITSGALPAVNFLDDKGNPHQFLQTSALIKDRRDIFELNLTRYGEENLATVTYGTSEEDDYSSEYGSVSYRFDMNQKRTMLTLGYGHSDDVVWNSYNPSVLLEEASEFNNRKKRRVKC